MRILVAGGGIGGLSFAALAAHGGHDVVVHERSPQIREIGAGLYLKPNALRALKHLGVLDDIHAAGIRILERRTRAGDGRPIQSHALTGRAETWMAPREALIQALRSRAEANGARIELGSTASRARAEGVLVTADGTEHEGDLIVAADGRYSALRNALGMTLRQDDLPTLATRYLVEDRMPTPEPVTIEYWQGRRRIGIVPASPTHTYSYVICDAGDEAGCAQPMDVESWAADFPVLRSTIETFATQTGVQHAYPIVNVRAWSSGRVALVGDAATALPPTLGQGSGLAMVNAAGLAAELCAASGIEESLAAWEAAYRPVSDRTQRWALRYDAMTNRWPAPVMPLRSPAIWAMNHIPMIRARLRAADNFRPTFTEGAHV